MSACKLTLIPLSPSGVSIKLNLLRSDLSALIEATSYSNVGIAADVFCVCDRVRFGATIARPKMISTATADSRTLLNIGFLRPSSTSPHSRASDAQRNGGRTEEDTG